MFLDDQERLVQVPNWWTRPRKHRACIRWLFDILEDPRAKTVVVTLSMKELTLFCILVVIIIPEGPVFTCCSEASVEIPSNIRTRRRLLQIVRNCARRISPETKSVVLSTTESTSNIATRSHSRQTALYLRRPANNRRLSDYAAAVPNFTVTCHSNHRNDFILRVGVILLHWYPLTFWQTLVVCRYWVCH